MKTLKLNEADYLSLYSSIGGALSQALKNQGLGNNSGLRKRVLMGSYLKDQELIKKFVGSQAKKLDVLESGAVGSGSFIGHVNSLLRNVHDQMVPWSILPKSEYDSTARSSTLDNKFDVSILGYTIATKMVVKDNWIRFRRLMHKYYYQLVVSMLRRKIPFFPRLEIRSPAKIEPSTDLVEIQVTIKLLPYSPAFSDRIVGIILDHFKKEMNSVYSTFSKTSRSSFEGAVINYQVLETSVRVAADRELEKDINSAIANEILSSTILSHKFQDNVGANQGDISLQFYMSNDSGSFQLFLNRLKTEDPNNILDSDVEDYIAKAMNPWTGIIYFEEPLRIANTLARRSIYAAPPVIEYDRESTSDSDSEKESDSD